MAAAKYGFRPAPRKAAATPTPSGSPACSSSAEALVVELYKSKGRRIGPALEPGQYEVRVEVEKAALLAKARVSDGARTVLGLRQFGAVALEATRRRGRDDTARFSVAGRGRLAVTAGGWGNNGRVLRHVMFGDLDLVSGASYARFLREDFAITFSMQAFGAEAGMGILGGFAAPLGVRWDPRHGDLAAQRLKPFLAAGIVPVSQIESSRYGVGLNVGAGADLHLSRSFSLGFKAGYNGFPTSSRAGARHDDYRGREITIDIGWLFGRPVGARP